MSKCIFRENNGQCLLHSDDEVAEYCVDGPCTNEIVFVEGAKMSESTISQANMVIESTIGQGKGNDLISRQKVLNIIDWAHYNYCFSPSEEWVFEYMKGLIDCCEDEVTHGKWENYTEPDADNNMKCTCSVCGAGDIQAVGVDVPYCWRCGAKMDKGGE